MDGRERALKIFFGTPRSPPQIPPLQPLDEAKRKEEESYRLRERMNSCRYEYTGLQLVAGLPNVLQYETHGLDSRAGPFIVMWPFCPQSFQKAIEDRKVRTLLLR